MSGPLHAISTEMQQAIVQGATMCIDRRLIDRDECQIEASVIVDGDACYACRVVNISEDGAKIEIDQKAPLPPFFILSLPLAGSSFDDRTVELCWHHGGEAGLRFVSRKHKGAAAHLAAHQFQRHHFPA